MTGLKTHASLQVKHNTKDSRKRESFFFVYIIDLTVVKYWNRFDTFGIVHKMSENIGGNFGAL